MRWLIYSIRLPSLARDCCGGRSRLAQVILKAAIDTATESKAVKSAEFERIAVDTAGQEKADKNKPYALHAPEIERISQRRRCPLGSKSIPKRLT